MCKENYKELLSSESWKEQVRGAILMSPRVTSAWHLSKCGLVIVVFLSLIVIIPWHSFLPTFQEWLGSPKFDCFCRTVSDFVSYNCLCTICRILLLLILPTIFGLACHVSKVLTPIFSLRKQETRVTWSQIAVLGTFGLMVLGLILISGVTKDSPAYLSLTAIGVILGWIFQDTIKSVVAFFYLRANGLIHIGDWIELKSHGVDGMLKTITLTTATVENWDTTTSAFPTYLLHSQHFQNNQKMMEGKTHGRRMLMSFIIDTGWIRNLTDEDVMKIKERLEYRAKSYYIDAKDYKKGALNIELYRKYLYRWLMRNPKVSQEPRLMVRWLEQTNEGMPLQIYAFITDTSLAAFEWQQSQIVEHAIKALEWFDLQLYQSPSGYDASNSNIYMAKEKANYRKEVNP